MASPFSIFRKHARILTVILTGLAMFAFIILDQIQNVPELALPILGIIVATTGFWLVGRQQNQGLPYAIGGALLGVVLFFGVLPFLSRPAAAVELNVGDLSEEELNRLIERRRTANSFLEIASYKLQQKYLEENAHRKDEISQFELPRVSPNFFFNYGRPGVEDIVLGHLLTLEADKMGVRVSDEAVNDFIKQATNEKLSRQDFRDIRSQLRLSEIQLFDVLREELKAKLALRMRLPETPPTPEEYWQLYRRTNVNQQLEVVAVPVDSFVTDKTPSEAELEAYFEAHKTKVPNQDGPGSPGFFQQRRIAFSYLEANYDDIQKQVPPVTDEEVQKYYDDNKEALYKNNILPSDDPQTKPDPEAPVAPDSGDTATPADSGEKTPAAGNENQPITPQLTPDSESPAPKPDSTPKTETAPEKPAPDAPQSNASPESKPETPKPQPESKPEATPPENAPASDSNSNDSSAGLDADLPQPTQFVLFQESSESQAADPPVEAPAPKLQAPASPDADGKPASSAPPDSKPADPASDTKPDDNAGKSPETETKPLPEYRPLDEFLKAEIREQLLEQRTREAVDKRIEAAMAEMYEIDNEYNAPIDLEKRIKPEEIAKRAEAVAKEHGLRYVVVEDLSASELSERSQLASEEHRENTTNPDREPTDKYRKYLVAQATEGGAADSFRPDAQTVIDELFSSSETRLFSSFVATEPLTNNRYIIWKTEDIAPHVPKLADEGIRDQVLAAWRLEQARKPAQQRAEEIAEKVKKALQAGSTMQDALAGETVTGKPDGLELSVEPTRSFSWMEASSAAPTNFFMPRQPEIANVPNIKKAGHDFMEVVFEKLDVGDVGVAPNADRSIFYVAHVTSRTPSTEAGIAAMRREFLNSDLFNSFFSSYVMMARERQQELNYNWSRKLEEQYGVRYRETLMSDGE